MAQKTSGQQKSQSLFHGTHTTGPEYGTPLTTSPVEAAVDEQAMGCGRRSSTIGVDVRASPHPHRHGTPPRAWGIGIVNPLSGVQVGQSRPRHVCPPTTWGAAQAGVASLTTTTVSGVDLESATPVSAASGGRASGGATGGLASGTTSTNGTMSGGAASGRAGSTTAAI